MPRRRQGARPEDLLGSLESRIMRVLWKHQKLPVGKILEEVNAQRDEPLAYNTVMSVTARLYQKGHLDRNRRGRAYVYSPALDEEAFMRDQAGKLARRLLRDFGAVGVAGFVDQIRDNAQLRAELERQLSEAN